MSALAESITSSSYILHTSMAPCLLTPPFNNRTLMVSHQRSTEHTFSHSLPSLLPTLPWDILRHHTITSPLHIIIPSITSPHHHPFTYHIITLSSVLAGPPHCRHCLYLGGFLKNLSVSSAGRGQHASQGPMWRHSITSQPDGRS